MLTIAISGSASLAAHPESVWVAFLNAIAALRDRVSAPPPYRFLHGDARGADRIIAAHLEQAGRDVTVVPADWDRHGREAGWLRNDALVGSADALVAIWDGYSAGTLHATNVALQRRIPWECRIIEPTSSVPRAHLFPWEELDGPPSRVAREPAVAG